MTEDVPQNNRQQYFKYFLISIGIAVLAVAVMFGYNYYHKVSCMEYHQLLQDMWDSIRDGKIMAVDINTGKNMTVLNPQFVDAEFDKFNDACGDIMELEIKG